jgi:hypothetical protein
MTECLIHSLVQIQAICYGYVQLSTCEIIQLKIQAYRTFLNMVLPFPSHQVY